MLEHTGRKTGIRRYVVLEAVDHRGPRTYIVAAGFGDRAEWLATSAPAPVSVPLPAATAQCPP
jgi:hypothetical protein